MADAPPTPHDASAGGARAYGLTLLVGLLGAVAVTVGVSRPWASATAEQTGNPTLEATVSGADLVPLAGALGVVMLAAFGAVVATRGLVRRGLGVAIALASAIVAASAARPPGAGDQLETALSAVGWAGGDYASSVEPWRWVTFTGAVACLAAGTAVARYGGRWPTMSARYDAPVAGADQAVPTAPNPDGAGDDSGDRPLSEAEVWRAIDEGRDPTRRP